MEKKLGPSIGLSEIPGDQPGEIMGISALLTLERMRLEFVVLIVFHHNL
jgi:hypothetical protein